MENMYYFIIIVLFALAILDLIVGVSNDAVNFLNSAIGSKVAPLKTILTHSEFWNIGRGNLFQWNDGSGEERHIPSRILFICGNHGGVFGSDDH